MATTRSEQLTILNAFVHDVATGTWISSLILLTILNVETQKLAWSPVVGLLPGLKGQFLALTWASLAIILLTGVVRLLTFKVFGWTGDVAADRVRLLKIKHGLLGVVFLAGTVYQVALVYF